MPDKERNNIYRYWGKASPSEEGGAACHLLPYHCLDVAAVGEILLGDQPALLDQLSQVSGLPPVDLLGWLPFLLTIHDIGKFADGFQNLKPDLMTSLQKRETQAAYQHRHDFWGYCFCRAYLPDLLIKASEIFEKEAICKEDLWDLLDPWISAVTGHHGRPPQLDINIPPMRMQFPAQVGSDVLCFIEETATLLLPNGFPLQLVQYENDTQFKRVSWCVAGLAVLSDWIGSNQRWFPYRVKRVPLSHYWKEIALPRARHAVDEAGLTVLRSAQSSKTTQLFSHIETVTPLQNLSETIALAEKPQLFIIEEVTGGGKTEAAITLAHRMMAHGHADGIFMALPTMATANAMHRRVRKMYQMLYRDGEQPSLILAHSASRMALDIEKKNIRDKEYTQGEQSASQDCTEWLSDGRKKALLAHVGVGTIDQALLGILHNRYQSLRLFGLVRKVLIVDEVHACDEYVFKLLCTLLKFHAAVGGSAILLSATLPQQMREQLLKAYSEEITLQPPKGKYAAYPLLTHFGEGRPKEIPFEARSATSRKVAVQPLHSKEEVTALLQRKLDGGDCVCWIRNTVYDALETYYEWFSRLGKERVMLFHARFTLGDRLKIEKEVLRRFGPDSTKEDRRGILLIATQVVEQSLDLDFDIMVSDLAPIDLLIQRAGRLQRHARENRGGPILGVYTPQPIEKAGKEWFKEMFPKGAGVYKHHGQLWLTAYWICQKKGFSMPDDARNMIESVYAESVQSRIPAALQKTEEKVEGEESAQRGLARFNQLNLDEGYLADMAQWQDDVYAPTRLGEPTVTVRLGRLNGAVLVPWIQGNTGHDWELSQVSIYQKVIAEEDPDWFPKAVTAAKAKMPDQGRYCLVIPLRQTGGQWRGQALNGQGNRVKVQYSNRIGLEIG
ncbi:MAG: CRISPR-associated helicase Cas3' [Nitrospiria bacterium]